MISVPMLVESGGGGVILLNRLRAADGQDSGRWSGVQVL
jgi:hypothetical protein